MGKNREEDREMPQADAFTLSTRVPNKTADAFKALADSLGKTPNALIKDMIERAVEGKPQIIGESTEKAREEVERGELHVPRGYKVALDLVDDLTTAGYPESEIEKAFLDIRRGML